MSNTAHAEGETASDTVANVPRVLLVEDDPLVARTIARLFRRRAIEVTLASSPSAAERLSGCFDVGVFDIDLPEKNGVDLARQCRAQGLVDEILFFSGTTEERQVAAARQLGEFIEKDQVYVLLDRVVAACERKSGIHTKRTP